MLNHWVRAIEKMTGPHFISDGNGSICNCHGMIRTMDIWIVPFLIHRLYLVAMPLDLRKIAVETNLSMGKYSRIGEASTSWCVPWAPYLVGQCPELVYNSRIMLCILCQQDSNAAAPSPTVGFKVCWEVE